MDVGDLTISQGLDFHGEVSIVLGGSEQRCKRVQECDGYLLDKLLEQLLGIRVRGKASIVGGVELLSLLNILPR